VFFIELKVSATSILINDPWLVVGRPGTHSEAMPPSRKAAQAGTVALATRRVVETAFLWKERKKQESVITVL
jgi:hypothetical protein